MTDTPDIPEEEPERRYFPAPDISGFTDAEIRRVTERFEFLEFIAKGQQPLHAAFAVGWTPKRMRTEMADPDFATLVADAANLVDESVVHAVLRQAQAGNMTAATFWLLNRQPNKWRDVKRVEVTQTHRLDDSQVTAIASAAKQLLAEVGPQALQPGGALDVLDAEVVDDTDS